MGQQYSTHVALKKYNTFGVLTFQSLEGIYERFFAEWKYLLIEGDRNLCHKIKG